MPAAMPRVLAIAGGVGGAKLALGLSRLLSPDELTIVVNTGDDDTFHGLHVSPDVDTMTYALAGLTNRQTGWGVEGDSFRTLDVLSRLGSETWFQLGDLDLGLHLRRTELLQQGWTLSEATRSIIEALGIAHPIFPMSDQPVRTIAVTELGEFAFQDYFVRQGCEPRITDIRFNGSATAQPTQGFADALDTADAIVFCPSNPIVSIGPILATPGVRAAIESFVGPRVAVSPLVGGRALKGPAGKMMAELGEEVSNVGIARRYMGLCDVLLIDHADRDEAPEIESLGVQPYISRIVMNTEDDKIFLAEQILECIGSAHAHG